MEDIRQNGRILSDSIQHITFKAVKGRLFPTNSIIIATTATIGEHALITVMNGVEIIQMFQGLPLLIWINSKGIKFQSILLASGKGLSKF
jgi:hypothetical protein